MYDEDLVQGVLLPVKFQFQKYLEKDNNLEKMLNYIESSSINNENLNNFTSGELWRDKCNHFQNKIVIPYYLHSDAFETNNALEANSNVHNILNIYSFPSDETSSLQNIFLAASIKSNDFKECGSEQCLLKFVFLFD